MDYLKSFLKHKWPYLFFHILLIVIFLLVLPENIEKVIDRLNGEGSYGYIKADVGVVILGPIMLSISSIPFVYKYGCVLLDLLCLKQKTVVIRGLGRPDIRGLQDVPLLKNDIAYSFWRTREPNGKKRVLYICDNYVREALHGETTRHWYRVTYYKHSKIVTHIEKANDIKQKIEKPGK